MRGRANACSSVALFCGRVLASCEPSTVCARPGPRQSPGYRVAPPCVRRLSWRGRAVASPLSAQAAMSRPAYVTYSALARASSRSRDARRTASAVLSRRPLRLAVTTLARASSRSRDARRTAGAVLSRRVAVSQPRRAAHCRRRPLSPSSASRRDAAPALRLAWRHGVAACGHGLGHGLGRRRMSRRRMGRAGDGSARGLMARSHRVPAAPS